MREYIQPTTEIVVTITERILGLMSETPKNEAGGGDGFTNTSEFETDLQQVEHKSLWED